MPAVVFGLDEIDRSCGPHDATYLAARKIDKAAGLRIVCRHPVDLDSRLRAVGVGAEQGVDSWMSGVTIAARR